MLKIRKEQLDALRAPVRAASPARLLGDLQSQGAAAEREAASGALAVTDPRGFKTRLFFQPDGLPAKLQLPSGLEFRLEHDELGRLAAIGYPGGERLELRRDARGNVVQVAHPEHSKYTFEFDGQDRLIAVAFPDGTSLRLEYGPAGSLVGLTDRAGAVTRYNRDEQGRLQSVVDPQGLTTVYEATEAGVLRAVVFPDGSREEYGFDPQTRVLSTRLRDGREVLQQLDEQGSVTRIDWPDGARAEFDFDDAGNLLLVESEAERLAWVYDGAGDPVAEQTSAGRVEYAYDPEGRLTRLGTPHGDTLEYQYDEDGRACLIRDWDGRENRVVWGRDGAVAEIQYGNGLVEFQQHAPLSRLVEARVVGPDRRVVSRQSYSYDSCERLRSISDWWGSQADQSLSRRLEYDPESRITAEIDAASGDRLARFEYDRDGNLVGDTGVPIRAGLLGEPLRYGQDSLEYDALGNMRRLPGPLGEIECRFAADGTLREARVGGRTVTYEYDPLCRRVRKTDGRSTWRYGWAGHQLLWEEFQEHPGAEPVRRDYLWFPDSTTPLAFREAGRTYWLQTDPRGAVIRAFDEAGEVVWRATYDSFGRAHVEVAQVCQPWRLMGHYHDDETGLHYNFARYYSPDLRSYLSRDPCWSEWGATNYSYARNDPWNRADPFGTIVPLLAGALIAVGVGALVGGIVSAATGGNFLAGAAEGALATAGTIVGGILGGPPGAIAGGVIGSGLGALAGSLIEQAWNGDKLCWPCALKLAGGAMALDLALLGLGRIPGVKRLARAVATRLARPIMRRLGRRTGTEIVQRAMSRAELEATKKTGLLRGGREGTHHVSDAVNSSSKRTRQRLALPKQPEVRVTMEVPAGKFSRPSKVSPAYNMPGGGMERTATGKIPVKILRVNAYK